MLTSGALPLAIDLVKIELTGSLLDFALGSPASFSRTSEGSAAAKNTGQQGLAPAYRAAAHEALAIGIVGVRR